MSQTKPPVNELPVTDKNTAEAIEPGVDATKTAAQILLEKKTAALKNRNLPSQLNPRANYKGKKIAAAPRGTRKSMGKR